MDSTLKITYVPKLLVKLLLKTALNAVLSQIYVCSVRQETTHWAMISNALLFA